MAAAAPQLHGLTALRGLAATGIVLHHFCAVLYPELGERAPGPAVYRAYLFVDLFFLLSGFVLTHVYQTAFADAVRGPGYRQYLLARLARIYPLHLVVLGLFVLLHGLHLLALASGTHPAPETAEELASRRNGSGFVINLLLLQAFSSSGSWNQPAWSISAEFVAYLLVPLMVLASARAGRAFSAAWACMAFAVLVGIEYWKGDLGLWWEGWPLVIRCLAEVTLGALLYRAHQSGQLRLAGPRAFVLISVLVVLLIGLPLPHTLAVVVFLGLILAATDLAAGPTALAERLGLLRLGQISYSIYMVHWLVMAAFSEAVLWWTGLHPRDGFPVGLQLLTVVIGLVVVLVLSEALYRLVETPARRALVASERLRRLLGLPANARRDGGRARGLATDR